MLFIILVLKALTGDNKFALNLPLDGLIIPSTESDQIFSIANL